MSIRPARPGSRRRARRGCPLLSRAPSCPRSRSTRRRGAHGTSRACEPFVGLLAADGGFLWSAEYDVSVSLCSRRSALRTLLYDVLMYQPGGLMRLRTKASGLATLFIAMVLVAAACSNSKSQTAPDRDPEQQRPGRHGCTHRRPRKVRPRTRPRRRRRQERDPGRGHHDARRTPSAASTRSTPTACRPTST